MTTVKAENGDTYFDVEKHYHQSEEYDAAMMFLDSKDVAKGESQPDGMFSYYSLVGRIEAYKDTA